MWVVRSASAIPPLTNLPYPVACPPSSGLSDARAAQRPPGPGDFNLRGTTTCGGHVATSPSAHLIGRRGSYSRLEMEFLANSPSPMTYDTAFPSISHSPLAGIVSRPRIIFNQADLHGMQAAKASVLVSAGGLGPPSPCDHTLSDVRPCSHCLAEKAPERRPGPADYAADIITSDHGAAYTIAKASSHTAGPSKFDLDGAFIWRTEYALKASCMALSTRGVAPSSSNFPNHSTCEEHHSPRFSSAV